MSWFSGFEAICRPEVPLRDHTWYRLGGPARWLCEPRNAGELQAVIRRLRDSQTPYRILGQGANILVRDSGVDAAVIRLAGQFEQTEFGDDFVRAGAAADGPRLVRSALQRGMVGLEVLAGIPGSVGGQVRMNAGGKYGEIASFVESVDVLEPDGELASRCADQLGFAYRRSDLRGAIVLGATLRLNRGDAAAALEQHRRIWNEKYETQPPLRERSAGCIFKNPPGAKAGVLLDQAGLKGFRVGGAEISSRHANFIVAYDGATASDVLALIAAARDRVFKRFDVELQLEIEVW